MPSDPRDRRSLFEIVADFERQLILDALRAEHGNHEKAAERLRIPLSTLNQKLKRLDVSDDNSAA